MSAGTAALIALRARTRCSMTCSTSDSPKRSAGPQGAGAATRRRAKMRAEAEQRNAATPWDRRAKSRHPCPHGKTRGYATEAEARTELVGTNIARNMGKAKRRECRVYECGACGRWHLTSKPRTTVRQVREP